MAKMGLLRVRIVIVLTILTAVAVASMLGSVYHLYNSYLDSEKTHLSSLVDRQVYILNTMAAYNAKAQALNGGATDTPLIILDDFFKTPAESTGALASQGGREVTIGRRNGEDIELFVIKDNQDDGELGVSRVVPWQSGLAEPLRQALKGEKGVMFARDYMGRSVLAAYAPTANGIWGVVTKVEVSHLQKPFVSVVLFASIAVLIIIILGVLLFRFLSHPFVQRMKVEEELDENRKQMEVILDNTADGIISMSEDGTILTFNRAAEKMFRYTPEEVLGKNIVVLMTSFDSERHGEYVKNYMSTHAKKIIGIGPREVNGVRKDGSLIPIDLAVNEVKSKDKVFFVGSMRDISERIIQRKRIQRSQKIEAIGQLTRGVATDFNGILVTIQENLDLLNSKYGSDKDTASYIHKASKASKHGVEMIQRLLAFSRRQQLTPESINIKEVITETVKLAKPSLGDKIEVSLDVSRDLWSIVADKSQLENALLSLSLNARDAMPTGGELKIKAENLDVDKDEARKLSVSPGEYIHISVKDNGMGMSSGVVDKVFQPFFTTKEFGKGSGLGLSIIHSFVHQTGGAISVKSEVDKGTEVDLLLPRHGQSSTP